jgi:hypothetical protein
LQSAWQQPEYLGKDQVVESPASTWLRHFVEAIGASK